MLKALLGTIKFIGWVIKETLLVSLDVAVIFSLAVFMVMAVYAYSEAPDVQFLSGRQVNQTTIIYDRTGKHVLYEIHGEENRKVIPHEEIPDLVRVATIATEDDSFYTHNGFDMKSIVRAAHANLTHNEIRQGGSTITQQLARSAFLTREKTIERKMKEVVLAFQIEKKFSKSDILDMYLNEVPYGSNAYGIQSAAEVYFKKDAKDLTLDEAVFLAALPKAPSYYSPYGNNADELVTRQKMIIRRLGELGAVGKEDVEKALAADTLEKVAPFQQSIQAPHFVFFVREELEREYGKEMVENGGFQVITTLDYDMQESAQRVVSEGAERNSQRYGGDNAALVAIDPKTGEILAMVGSRDFFDEEKDGQVNVTTRLRQPGSSIKPIIYATAFEQGYQPESFVLDTRTNFGRDGSGRDYIPRNYSGKHYGRVTLRQALSMSLNVPAVKMLETVGLGKAIGMAERLGIRSFDNENRNYGLSLAIGGGDITLLEGTTAFSVFANDGYKPPLTSIKEIKSAYGDVLTVHNPGAGERVIDSSVARKINSVLSDNQARTPVFGPSSPLHIPGRTVAAKTGTTQEYRDALAIGYTPSLAVGVWAGNNDSRPMKAGADGSFVAAPIWNQFMVGALERFPEESFIPYEKENRAENVSLPQEKSQNITPEIQKNIERGKRPSGWSKKEWDRFKKELGL